MNKHDHRFLLSERGALNKLISQTSPGNVIGRMSLEHRLKKVEAELEAYEGLSSRIVDARLTFSGTPVFGSRGIEADFAGEVVKKFADAVACFGASLDRVLSAKGPIPNRKRYDLLITGTAPGSFGFEVEDASQQMVSTEEFPAVERAIERVKGVLEASVGTDEHLANTIAGTDRRALRSLRIFLKAVADAEAVCALTFQGDEFRFRDTDQVRRSAERLSEDIQEYNRWLIGRFRGFLPRERDAEFVISEEFWSEMDRSTITARVDPAVDDAVDINRILNEDVRIGIHAWQVGSRQSRYVIYSVEPVRER